MWLTPLWPAGHLPHKEGDRLGERTPLHSQHERWPRADHDSISPPVGEMPGKAEGGKPHPPPPTITLTQTLWHRFRKPLQLVVTESKLGELEHGNTV
ncbi:hypothetical protein CTT39_03900 [Agrobacterium rosae]|nr:hypothetical protein CTT39_03900 [Agrobacterium rosae]